jgi:ribosomal protein L37AE/L43A
MSTELVVHSGESQELARFLPVMSLEIAVERRETIVKAVKSLMHEDQDYGKIPGTPKPTLYQPGADKLNNLFGLVPQFSPIREDEDWTGERHGGEPFFAYTVKCRLFRGDYLMGEGEGSCNSWESKYRWRKSERKCPRCGKENIRKSKDGSWYCWQKTGGCGATYRAGDQAIESQTVGSKPNPDIFDLVNTIRKMANKRAKIAATLNATSAHEFFTQDVEDLARPEEPPTPPAETRDQVIERRMAEERAKAPYQATDDDLPANLGGTHADDGRPSAAAKVEAARKDPYKEMLRGLEAMKAELHQLTGANDEYYRILGDTPESYGHANDIKSVDQGRQMYKVMRDRVKELRAAQEGAAA